MCFSISLPRFYGVYRLLPLKRAVQRLDCVFASATLTNFNEVLLLPHIYHTIPPVWVQIMPLLRHTNLAFACVCVYLLMFYVILLVFEPFCVYFCHFEGVWGRKSIPAITHFTTLINFCVVKVVLCKHLSIATATFCPYNTIPIPFQYPRRS